MSSCTLTILSAPEASSSVRSRDFQLAIFEDKQEVLQDGKRRLGRDGLGNVQEGFQEIVAGNVEFHIVSVFLDNVS